MAARDRELDVVVWGATGFTGRLVAEYLLVSTVFDAYQLISADGLLSGLGWIGLVGPAVMAFGSQVGELAS